MRPLDYSDKQPDGLYARCICGWPWSAHRVREGIGGGIKFVDSDLRNGHACERYRPMIGHFGASKNKPIKTYRETFGAATEHPDVTKWVHYEGFDQKFKAEHTHTIARNVLNRIAAHGAREFPRECCGFILGDKVEDVRPIKNTNKYGGGSYTMDFAQQIAVLKEVENGKLLKVVYHSHPNMGAFFSAIDRDAASSIDPKKPDWPDTVWIVMSIRSPGRYGTRSKLPPQLADARAYLWNPAITDFSEITLKVVE